MCGAGDGQILAFRFKEERWRLACRALAVSRQALESYEPYQHVMEARLRRQVHGGGLGVVEVLYDALSDEEASRRRSLR